MAQLLPRRASSVRVLFRRVLCAGLFALTSATNLLADTSSALRSAPAGGCYCCCNESHSAAGCVKMCELPKYASRWWATTCAKPRMRRPAENSDAGPHLHHPDHATYAQLQPKDR